MKQDTHHVGKQLVGLLETTFLSGDPAYASAILVTDYGDCSGFYTVVRLSLYSRTHHPANLCVHIQEPVAGHTEKPISIMYLKNSDGIEQIVSCTPHPSPPFAESIPRQYAGMHIGLAIVDMYTYLTTGRLYRGSVH